MLRLLTILSICTLATTFLVVPVIVARMREDYWVREKLPTEWRHPVLRMCALVFKNVLGTILIVAGIAMIVLPGPGSLTILVGLSLVNFPGKREMELRIIRIGPVRTAVQWLRKKVGRPPLLIP